ncbi:hypothetical protein PILCRDRAFT_4215 [Piloderma croceum F 1598]|uniref:Uncharacterized protein n=1 Tax=Piloderma croceum (strain F 1598) TaxID=765440 RepID=A0A0C3BKL3_PILCF|nr:hypothetical protein PILCRDRAFT_4215 [Piloderma croceum F 1598]
MAGMVVWRMDGGAPEVLSEWVVDADRELMEREAVNRKEGGKERGNVSSPDALDSLETSPQPPRLSNPYLPPSLRRRNRLPYHLDQTSSLFQRSPSTTVNDHPVSGISNGGGTVEGFVFDPEIVGAFMRCGMIRCFRG